MDNKLILNYVILIFLSFSSYLIPSTYLPEIALEKGCDITVIGFIISLFPISGAFTSLYIGKNMTKLGRKWLTKVGGYLLAISMIIFAFSVYI